MGEQISFQNYIKKGEMYVPYETLEQSQREEWERYHWGKALSELSCSPEETKNG